MFPCLCDTSLYYLVRTTCYNCWWFFSVTTDGRELCQLLRLVLRSRKMVLIVPHPWYRPCYRHSWPVVLRHTLKLDRIDCQHPSYSMWAHNPQFHRTETWLFFTFLFRGYSPWLTSYALHEPPNLWCPVRYQTQCLCLRLWDSLFLIHHRHQMHAHPLETPHTFFCSSRCNPLS